jgi:hypothetical protein
MTKRSWAFLVLVAVPCAAWLGLACSSSGGSAGDSGADAPVGDAPVADAPSAAADTSAGDATPEANGAVDSTSTANACDGSIALPSDGAPGAACAQCLEANCGSSLTMCKADCDCVSSIECLASHADNYTLCPDALTAIGAGNPGLMAVAACLAMSCVMVCNPGD